MALPWEQERRTVAETARRMERLGLVTGTAGNVSLRLRDAERRPLLAVTPSGFPYEEMSAGDVLVVDFDLEPVEGEGVPSSESLMHVEIYRSRPDVGAVIHTHPVFATVAAVAGLEIPPILDEMTIYIGGTVRVSEYAAPGGQELAHRVREALGDRKAALIRNHGAVGVGKDLREALEVCLLTERAAQVFVYCSLLGKVGEIPAAVLEAQQGIYRMRLEAAEPDG